jgi:hypothetical protein
LFPALSKKSGKSTIQPLAATKRAIHRKDAKDAKKKTAYQEILSGK